MTRKDEMKKGFVAHTFHLPMDLDDKLRMEAVRTHVRFSDIAISALQKYLKWGNEK
jgi:hypothetical protein